MLVLFVNKYFSPSDKKASWAALLLSLSTFLFFPNYWIPILFGYPDAVGVFIIFLIFFLLMRRPFEEQKLGSIVLFGISLSILIMMRRWYAYWVVSFFIALAVERLSVLFPKYHFHIKDYWTAARNILVIGTTSVAFFFICAGPIGVKMITANYADIFSAYKSGMSTKRIFLNLYVHFGLFITTLFIAASILGLYIRRSRHLFIFIIVQFVTVFLLFSRVQDFDRHHLYLFIPAMVIVISFFVSTLSDYLKNMPAKILLSVSYIMVLIIQSAIIFFPWGADKFPKMTPLFSSDRHYPLVRNDMEHIHSLMNVLAGILKDKNTSVYIPASSTVLNDAF